jgi:hypothetical protein
MGSIRDMLGAKAGGELGHSNELFPVRTGRGTYPQAAWRRFVMWDEIPASKQNKLMAQACLMPDRETTTSLNEQIRVFIRESKRLCNVPRGVISP